MEDQGFALVDLICCVVAGLCGFALARARRLTSDQEGFAVLLFFTVFCLVVAVAVGGVLPLVALVAGVLFALSIVAVEWLMPLPDRQPSDEDDDDD